MAKQYGERWEVIESLGEGGQAHVYLVRDLKNPDGPTRVLKRLKDVAGRMDRFKGEIDALKNVSHPNVLTIVDSNMSDAPYIVAEYCPGGTLAQRAGRYREPMAALGVFHRSAMALRLRKNNRLYTAISSQRTSCSGTEMNQFCPILGYAISREGNGIRSLGRPSALEVSLRQNWRRVVRNPSLPPRTPIHWGCCCTGCWPDGSCRANAIATRNTT
jgi:hypothetical protein